MLDMFNNNPSTSVTIMLAAIAAMNYYIRKSQIIRIQECYKKMVKDQERKTQQLAYDLLADICCS